MSTKQPRFHRKHYFIDRKFQGRYMLTFFVPMVVMLGFMLFTLYFASIMIVDTTTRIIKRDVDNNIALQLQDQPTPSVDRYQKIVSDITGYIKSFSESTMLKREMLGTLLVVFGIGLLLVIVQVVFLTIFFSHKVAGPVYRFECVCHDVIEGRYTDTIKLRKGDEMMNLAELFNQAMAATRQRMVDLLNAESDQKRKEIASRLEL